MFQSIIGFVLALAGILLTAIALLLSTTTFSPTMTLGMLIGGMAATGLGAMTMGKA